ncbi:MAG: spore coat protein [Bacillales bacterium]|jgi:sporulation protein YabP|nr:spore coat protein [Bacillales bacterium]
MNNNFETQTNKVVSQEHNLLMRSRKVLELTGIKQVETFDHEEFLLETIMGFMVVRGEDLSMQNFDMAKGTVAIKGKINEIAYLDENISGEKAKGFFSKIFK